MSPRLVDYLTYEPEDGGICWIKLNRPERMNAVIGRRGESSVVKVGEYMRAADDDPNVRVIVLTGVGRAFRAGVDLRSRLRQTSRRRPSAALAARTGEHLRHGRTSITG